jgi:EAL domain-containing protein (putative c-di-GMP-specific phosphodiesterase class I)
LTIAVERDSEDLEHLLALTARLQALGLRSIAGQVDAMALLPRLWSAGINYVQGNCLAAPSEQLAYNFPRRMTLSPAPPDPR